MSNSSVPNTFETALNLISLIIDILGLLICLIFLCAIIYRLAQIKYNQGLIIIDVPLILSINIICIIFIKSSLEITHVIIPTLMKDFQIMIEFKETPFYRFRAYMLRSIGCALYWSYVLLAFFRFARVIYPTKVWLHRSTLYLYVFIPSLLICVFIINLPLLFGFDSLHQIPDQAYCSTLVTAFAPSTYTASITFFIPISVMCIFYISIARKIRQSSMIRAEHEMHRRDFIVIRRMLFNLFFLNIVAIPNFILYIIAAIQNHFGSILYRTEWLSWSMASALFSIILPTITTRLQEFLRPNRIRPGNHHT